MRIISTLFAVTLTTLCAGSALAETQTDAPVLRAVERLDQPARIIRVQELNNPPVCTSWSIKLGAPIYATASGTIGFRHKCSDPDGDPITIISPGETYNFTLYPGESTQTIGFTASDGRGGYGSAILTINK